MQVLRLVSFVTIAATLALASEAAAEEKRLVPGLSGGEVPLDGLPLKRLLPGGQDPLEGLTGGLPVKRLSSLSSLPISSLTSSLSGVTAVKRAVEELVAQEKRLSPEALPPLPGLLGGGLPVRRQVDLLNQLGGLGGLVPGASKRLAADPSTALTGILSGGSPTKRQVDVLNAVGGLSGIASQSEKRQLEILNALAGGESEDQSEFKRQLGILKSLPVGSAIPFKRDVPLVGGILGGSPGDLPLPFKRDVPLVGGILGGSPGDLPLPFKRDSHHNKRTEMALRALPGADAITGILSSGTEAQKRLLDSLSALPGADTFTSLASGGLPSKRQLELLSSIGGIGGLAGQDVKRQVEFLQALGDIDGTSGMETRSNLSDEAMKYAYELMSERSQDGKGQRPVSRTNGGGNYNSCNVGKAQCCNQVVKDESQKKTLAGLAGLSDVVGEIALSCTQLPIGVLPIAAQNVCSSTPLCCSNVTQDGLVNFGCSSLPIN